MLKYFQTTTLILLWCFALTLVWAYGAYRRAARSSRAGTLSASLAGVIAPALVVGPLALVLAFRALGINLLFPVHFFAELQTLLAAAFAPALVLVVSSGLAGSLTRQIRKEYAYWEAKTFTLMTRAVGRRTEDALRRLVLVKSLCGAWSQCLPWLFGELIIVESVFNAPGLGLDAWHLARVRDLNGLATTIAWLGVLYGACVLLTATVNRWIGRRLESYG